MSGKCFCHFNGYEVKDAAARQKCIELDGRVESLELNGSSGGSGSVTPKLCSDANNATTAGFYFMVLPASNVPDGFSGDSTLLVEWHQNGLQQTIKQNNMIAIRCYNLWTGTWNPWEYVNPPLIDGVEYRTTEMYKGLPVYARLIRYYAQGVTGQVSIPAYFGASQLVSITGTISEGDMVYSLSDNYMIENLCFYAKNGSIDATVKTSYSLYAQFEIVLKYTK